jgi:AcrR family transcriptional regulator
MTRKTKEEVLEEYRCGSIQDAALAVIARKGLEEATIQEIADEAGVAKGTVYVYFRDRDELLARTADLVFDRLFAALEPAFNAESSFSARLTDLVLRQLEFFEENVPLLRATIALSNKSRSASHARYIERVETMFAEAKQRGEIRDVDPLAVAAVYRDCVRGLLLRRVEKKSTTDRRDEAAFLASILLRGIGTDVQETTDEA